MLPVSHAAPNAAQRTADAAAWLREFYTHDDGGRIRLAEHTAQGWAEYPRGVSLHDGPEPFADMAQALAEALVEQSEHADVYACPYAHDGERHKGGAVARRHAHADVDGPLDLATVRELGALAVASGSTSQGTPHGHVYVRLSRPVSAAEHTALCAALGAHLGPDADASKVADNDVLRPAGTLNHKRGRRARVAWLIGPEAPTVRTWEPSELAAHLGTAWPVHDAPTPAQGTHTAATASVRPRTGLQVRAELGELADGVAGAAPGAGNAALNAAAYRVARLVTEAAPGDDLPAEAQVREVLVSAFLSRPVPAGESSDTRRREAEATVRSGWSSGLNAPAHTASAAPVPAPVPAVDVVDAGEPQGTAVDARVPDALELAESETFRRDVDAEKYRIAVRDAARRERSAELADQAPVPTPQALAEFIGAHADDAAEWRVEGLWPAGGRVLLVAAYKAGKTTTVANLVRSLVDGEPFLGRFTVEHADGHAPRVVIVDTEMTESQLARWLRDSQITRHDLVSVLPLRGQLATFNVMDAALADRWAETLRGADVVILDNLRPVLDALGLDENREAGRFLTAWDGLMASAGVGESLVVHHAGHGQDRARGDSALMASNDAIWTLRRDGESAGAARYFRAMGRDVNVPEALVEFTEPTRRLRLSTALPDPEAPALEVLPRLVAYLAADQGGRSMNALESHAREGDWCSRAVLRTAVKVGVRRGLLTEHKAQRGARVLFASSAGREWIVSTSGKGANSDLTSPRGGGELAEIDSANTPTSPPENRRGQSAESCGF